MDEKKRNNGRDGFKPYIPLVIAIISGFAITLGGNYYLVRGVTPEVIAPDRFTGTEGQSLKNEIKVIRSDIQKLKLQISRLPPRDLLDRLIAIEVKLNRLEQEVDKHHP